jgi:hypothetical protein
MRLYYIYIITALHTSERFADAAVRQLGSNRRCGGHVASIGQTQMTPMQTHSGCCNAIPALWVRASVKYRVIERDGMQAMARGRRSGGGPGWRAGLLDKLVRAHQSGMVSPIALAALSLTVSANLHEQLLYLGAAQRK